MASQNGATQPSGREIVDGIKKKDEAKGATVHSFDPNASPAEKASAAGKARDQTQSIKQNGADKGGTGAYAYYSAESQCSLMSATV